MIPSHIIQQYYLFYQENSFDFCPLGRSSLYSLLDVCKASTRKSLQDINYFAADAGEAFDSIGKLIDELNLDIARHRRLLENLKRGRQYLKSDYQVHVTKSSTVIDHCATFALSDKYSKGFRQMCDHEHNDTCDECLSLRVTFDEIIHAVNSSNYDKQLSAPLLEKFWSYQETIDVWKSHLLRAINQGLCRQEIIETLGNNAVYIYMDWAMKWLSQKYRESQSDFFGKHCLSWHISVVVCKNEQLTADADENTDDNNASAYLIIVHAFDHYVQDSEIVVALLRDVLLRVQQVDRNIKIACITFDNADCYHLAQTVLSLLKISYESGIQIRRIDFCDPQGGKGPCDRYTAVMKSHVRHFLNEKHNVTTTAEFVEAIYSNEGIRGVYAYEAHLGKTSSDPPLKLVKISLLNHFSLDPTSIHIHRAWKVGDGKPIPFSTLEQLKSISTITCSNTPKDKTLLFVTT